MTDKYFLYDPDGDGFQTFATAEMRDAKAKLAIEECLSEDGWAEDVLSIVVGEISGVASKVNVEKRPPESEIDNEYDEAGYYWPSGMDEKFNVEIVAIEQATAQPAPADGAKESE